LNREGRETFIYWFVGLAGKENNIFFQKSCQVKKQLYICTRLGKHLRETRPCYRKVLGRVEGSSLKYCGDKNREKVRTFSRGTRIKETYNFSVSQDI
jgi:hypothetical protein